MRSLAVCCAAWLAVLCGGGALWGTDAHAHTALLEPAARYERAFQKDGPCGHPSNPPGEPVAAFQPGADVRMRWEEFVGHPGHFRISLSDEGDGAFVDPTDYDDFFAAQNVLVDDIDDPEGQTFHDLTITLPDIECERCVLQLIQVMADKPPFGPEGGNDLYYQCADITIDPSAPETPIGDEDGCGCRNTDALPTPGALLLLLFIRRRSGARRCRRRSS